MSEEHKDELNSSTETSLDYTILFLLKELGSLTLYFGPKNDILEKYKEERPHVLYYQPGHEENLKNSPIEALKKQRLVYRMITKEPEVGAYEYSLTEVGETKVEEEKSKISPVEYTELMKKLYIEDEQRKLLKLEFGSI